MKILKLTKGNQQIFVREIKRGSILVFPTDTVYGLICVANNKKSIEKIFKIKGRSKRKPISIFVKDLEMAEKYINIKKGEKRFLRQVWPGAVTVVVRSKKGKLNTISGKKNTIGVRIPDYKFIINLIKKINFPLAETSANISGKGSTTKIKEVIEQFKNKRYKPDLVVDAGNLKRSKSSTVVDLTGSKIKVLRSGSVFKKEIQKYFK